MAREIAFVADDFGMSGEINHAIEFSHTFGGLHAAALMTGQPGTADAADRTRRLPGLQVGWHLHLNDSLPVTVERWPWGASPARAGWSIGLFRSARELARREIVRQWELFQETGLECRFVNCHHHLHAHPFVYRTLLEVLGPGFKGWIRLGALKAFSPAPAFAAGAAAAELFQRRRRRLSPWRATDTLWGVDRVFRMDAAEVAPAIAGLGDGFHEFLFHPRQPDATDPDTRCLLALRSFASA